MTPANQSTPEVTSHAADILDQYASFIRNDVKADDFERHPYVPEIEETAQALRDLATPARGGDELREATFAGYRLQGPDGEDYFNDTATPLSDNDRRNGWVETPLYALASTDMAGAGQGVRDRAAWSFVLGIAQQTGGTKEDLRTGLRLIADRAARSLSNAAPPVEGLRSEDDMWTRTIPVCPVSDETADILAMIAENGGTGEIGAAAVAGVDTIWGCADPTQPEQGEQIKRARGNIVVAIRAAVAGITLVAGDPPNGF